MGLLCLSPQLVQDPSIQRKGRREQPKPSLSVGGQMLCAVREDGVRLSPPHSLSPSHASATWTVVLFHNFELGSASGPLQSGLSWLSTSSLAPVPYPSPASYTPSSESVPGYPSSPHWISWFSFLTTCSPCPQRSLSCLPPAPGYTFPKIPGLWYLLMRKPIVCVQ